MCAPRLLPPEGLQRRARGPEQPEPPAPGAADRAHVPAVPSDPHVCHRGWKMCALLLAGDGPSSLPSHRPVAVTRFLSVVWLQQESSLLQPSPLCSSRHPGAHGVLSAKIPAPTSPAQNTSPGPGHGQHVALTQQLSWPGILHGKWLRMVALTSTPAPHCLSTSNARRDAAGWSRLAAVLQRSPSLSALSGHHGQHWRLPCHPHLRFKLASSSRGSPEAPAPGGPSV